MLRRERKPVILLGWETGQWFLLSAAFLQSGAKGKASHLKTECVVFTHKACFLIVKLALTYLAGSLSRLKNVNMSDEAPFHRELCEYKLVECNFSIKKKPSIGTSLEVQWLRLHASSAGGMGLILGGRTKIPHASQHSQKIKNKPTSITYKIK